MTEIYTTTFQRVAALARQLPTIDKVRLVEQLVPEISRDLQKAHPLQSLLGLCTDLGSAPSAEEIDTVRQEMWATFPREDI